ncbi:catecholate siderophore receptor [Litorivivens lipolytica]|uniref:Catecholate siderophore receptor n=1 Tax=Litorivivens lipolytica TaxID=1524264 RepID=A0A7W4W544_9GAMM|nr:TonB-dependent siderophore receptor [Litorivivens lipolytica]MBB3047661.1 catecholate siderophore receptor [Litorivivens lipolytica]
MLSSKTGLSALAAAISLAAANQSLAEKKYEELIVKGQYLSINEVTAVKTPTPIIDVPQSLSIVTAEQIQQQGFTSIGDIINYTPGVNTSQGEGHRDAVVFRGRRATADFFIDGVRDDVQYYRSLYNLKQVEVLRGPNALFFGRGGTGGALNRVTKKGVIGEDFARYQASLDTFDETALGFDGNVTLSDNAALRLNVMAESLKNHRDFYEGYRFGVNPTLRLSLGEDTSLDISYEYANHERFIDRGIPTGADGRPVEEFEDIVLGDKNVNESDLLANLFRVTVQHSFSDALKGNLTAFYGDYEKLYQNFYASSYDQAASPNEVTLDGYVDTTDRQNAILSGNLIGEFATGDIGHTVIFGVEYIDTSSDQDRWNAFWDTTSDDNEVFSIQRPLNLRNGVGVNANGVVTTNNFNVDINDDTRVKLDVTSVYLQDEIEISEHLDVVLGARFDSFDIDVNNVVANEKRSRKDEEVSPRAGIVYKPQENISIYASYSESFLPKSGEQFANINGAANDLDPNTYENREVGMKWDFSNGLSFTAAIFENEESAPEVDDNDPNAFVVVDSEIEGYELQLEGQLTDRWFLSASYGNLDGEIVNQSGPTGLRPRELPEHMASIWTMYQLTNNLGLGLGATYQDESFIDSGNNAELPSYTRTDMAIIYDVSATLRVQLNIENLTDELYFPNAHSTHQVTVGESRSARLTISGDF